MPPKLRNEILQGKRNWHYTDYGNDPDIFMTDVVTPLENLVRSEVIENLATLKMHRRGASFVARIDILGEVHLDRLGIADQG